MMEGSDERKEKEEERNLVLFDHGPEGQKCSMIGIPAEGRGRGSSEMRLDQ